MARDKTIVEQIESTLYSAGVSNSGEIAQVVWEGVVEQSEPLYHYTDDTGTTMYSTDVETITYYFGVSSEQVSMGIFVPNKIPQ